MSEQIMGNSLTLLLVVSAVLTVILQLFTEPLLLTFGASENTIGYAISYMRIYSLGTVFVLITLGMNAYITAQGFTTVSMKTVLIGAILNTILDPIFIFGLDMGVRGAALATILSQAVRPVGPAVPHWSQDQVASASEVPPPEAVGISPLPGPGPLPLHHAKHRESYCRVLQHLPAEIWQ